MTEDQEGDTVNALLHDILKTCNGLPVHIVLTALTRSIASVIVLSTGEEGYENIIKVADEALREAIKMAEIGTFDDLETETMN
jgi:hypothetical protein